MSGIPPELSRDHAVAAYVAWRVGATGPAFVVSAACASGTIAVLNGYDLIRSGGASAVVVGGIELVSPELESGYRTMGMISEQPARPFDRSARGAQLASACAFTVLRPATRRRTAPSVIVAHGACVTGRSSEEVGPLVRALASLPGTADVAVFAHGAAVQASDSVEAASIRRARSGAPVVALKGRIGHTLGAAGVLEMILAMRALETGVLPGASSTRDEDVGYDIDLVTTDRRQRVDAVVCSSLGLGGFEAAVVVA
jgi:3-oxoacyl-[acyl-carrier-protein] synthase-1